MYGAGMARTPVVCMAISVLIGAVQAFAPAPELVLPRPRGAKSAGVLAQRAAHRIHVTTRKAPARPAQQPKVAAIASPAAADAEDDDEDEEETTAPAPTTGE